eukprot:TRINITY_DN874_c0_g1_i1.p1 TRINITY_DN874_c0_g1~~TRINITY_DN874_c0_g1_i1.p1  ORF type:complete len:401 (-),score=79.28 TRINITY_DN874_c0_g1_i1:47-1249(-)
MPERKEGDWDCPKCGEFVFASRSTCFRCDREAKGQGKAGGRREGDWDCPTCGQLVYGSKDACPFCERAAKGESKGKSGERREGDWDCPKCGQLVYASKDACPFCERAAKGESKGKSGGRREGDWDCPVCGELVFASKDSCFACERAGRSQSKGQSKGQSSNDQRIGKKPGDWNCRDCGALMFAGRESCMICERRANDWTCPGCSTLVFGSKDSCFKCGEPRGGSGADTGRRHDENSSRTTAGGGAAQDGIRGMLACSRSFQRAWEDYCKSYGHGHTDPLKYSDGYVHSFADFVADSVQAKLHSDRSTHGKQHDGSAKRRRLGGGNRDQANLRKAFEDEVQRLNDMGGLAAPLRPEAIAASMRYVDEEAGMKIFEELELQQLEVDDPNKFIQEKAAQATSW